MKLWSWPVDRPVGTLMILLSLVVLGVVALFRLPLDYWPTVEPPVIVVEVPYPGSHPLEVLRTVGKPLEEEIATIPDIKSLRVSANSGNANVRVRFDWDHGDQRLRSNYVVLYRYRDGLIARQEIFYDPSGHLERLQPS